MKKNVLFFYSRITSFTNAVRDYVNAFRDHSEHNIFYYDLDTMFYEINLEPFDCIIFNFCVWGHSLPEDEDFVSRIARFKGQKIAILQDEYDYFLWRKDTIIRMGIDTIVTCVPPQHLRYVFQDTAFQDVKFIHALTGYIPEYLLKMPKPKPFQNRDWWIGYRSRPVPFRYGKLTQEKVIIGRRMKEICQERNIPINIELTEESRIYGQEWPEFIRNCRAVLSTETGSNIFDFDGTIASSIDSYLALHPDTDFETVYSLFLADHEGRIRMNQVSPRVFEAIALGTALVLFEGDYSGILQPWEHYIPLRKDFGNIEEVFEVLGNTNELQSMTHRAYKDIIESGKYHYRTYISTVDSCISQGPTNRAANYQQMHSFVGWRINGSGLMPATDWNLAMITEQPLKHSDWHYNLPPHFSISFRWNRFAKCLWFWPVNMDYEPVFEVAGWKENVSEEVLPAVRERTGKLKIKKLLIGRTFLAIHCDKEGMNFSLVIAYNRIYGSCRSVYFFVTRRIKKIIA